MNLFAIILVSIIVILIIGFIWFATVNLEDKGELIWVDGGLWRIINLDDFGSYETTNNAIYEIYQRKDGTFYLKTGGYKPKEHTVYKQAVNKLQEFRNQNKPI